MKRNKSIKKKLIELLKAGRIDIFNRYRKYTRYKVIDFRNADLRIAFLSYADLTNADLTNADLKGTNLENVNLKNADLDFSCLEFSCNSLKVKYDQRHIVQILAHACIPTMHNDLGLDEDVEALLNSELMLNVLAKAHRKELRTFKGTFKKLKEEK